TGFWSPSMSIAFTPDVPRSRPRYMGGFLLARRTIGSRRYFFELRNKYARTLAAGKERGRGKPVIRNLAGLIRADQPLRAFHEKLRKRAVGSLVIPFGRQCPRQRRLPGSDRCLDQGQLDYVALCMAAAETVGDVADGADEFDATHVVAFAEGVDRLGDRVADIARESGIVALSVHRLLLRGQQHAGRFDPSCSDEGHHRVCIVEGVVTGSS